MSEEVIDLVSDDDSEPFGAESSTADRVPTSTLNDLPKIVAVQSLAWRKNPPASMKKAILQQKLCKTVLNIAELLNIPSTSREEICQVTFESTPRVPNIGALPSEPLTPLPLNNGQPPTALEPVTEEPPAKRAKVDDECSSAAGTKNTLLFKTFIASCVSFEDNEHDRKRVEEKLQSYFDKSSSQYVNSKTFGDLLKTQTQALNKDRLYYCLKAVLDELKRNRLSNRIAPTPVPGSSKLAPSTSSNDEETVVEKSPDERRVKKLMRAMNKVDRKIKKLEQREVDWDADENSSFILMSRYRDRFTALHKKFCEVTGAPLHAESLSKKKIAFTGTKYPKVNLLIERWINKKRIFPDYLDVYNLIKSEIADLPPNMISVIAQDAFQKIGEQLQKLRKLDLWDSLESLVSDDKDPAKDDPQLAATLEQNRKLFRKKEQEKIDEFVTKQLESKDKKELEADENELSEEEEEGEKSGEDEENKKSDEEDDGKEDSDSSQSSDDLDDDPSVPDLQPKENRDSKTSIETENTVKTDPENASELQKTIIENDDTKKSNNAGKNAEKAPDSEEMIIDNGETKKANKAEKNAEKAPDSEKMIIDNGETKTENEAEKAPDSEKMIIDNGEPKTANDVEKNAENAPDSEKISIDNGETKTANEAETNAENVPDSGKMMNEATDNEDSKMKTPIVKNENGTRTPAKPFGSAGDVIVIDYFFIRYNISFETWPSLKKGKKYLKLRKKKLKKKFLPDLNMYSSWGPMKIFAKSQIQEIVEKYYKSLLMAFVGEADEEEQDKTNGKSK